MRRLLPLLPLLLASTLFAQRTPPATAPARPAPATTWSSPAFAVGLDDHGLFTTLANPADPLHMNWIRDAGPAWGVPMSKEAGKLTTWDPPTLAASTPNSNELHFTRGPLALTLKQSLASDHLTQTYTLTNTGNAPITFAEGDFGIRIPLPDNYPDASTALTQRCNVHLWTAGSTAWINATRMNGAAPHLGLVLTDGMLKAYAITDRPWNSNDRGTFVLHPALATLQPNASTTFAWTLFWHTGWDDFFAQAQKTPQFVRMQADRYTVTLGETLHLSIDSATPLKKVMLVNNYLGAKQLTSIPLQRNGQTLTADVTPTALGDQLFLLIADDYTTTLRAFVTPDPMKLIDARVRFILDHQQKNAPGDKNDGALLAYDNETHQLVLEKSNDRNAGRERVGMGVLLALYLPRCTDDALKTRITDALTRYDAFVSHHLQDSTGKVFNDTDDPKQRLYNYPWVARFHLSMYRATGEAAHLDACVRTLQAYYANGGQRFYAIGMPITDTLAELTAANRTDDRDALLTLFKAHADRLIATGTNMPKSEVNYEQSIVAPACEILLQTAAATGDKKYREAAQPFLAALDAFNGQQPDHHLHDLAIRHWDDYWFGKGKLYGDTFPHYWSTLTACVLNDEARLDTQEAAALETRAANILANNLSLFSPDGSASCAYVYPLSVDDHPGRFYDAWANDQDWALVNYLLVHHAP